MKNWTNALIIVLCLAAAYAFFYLALGAEGNFKDPVTGLVDMHNPQNALGMIYTGGPLVGLLIACVLLALTFTVERWLSITKAQGSANMHTFGRTVIEKLDKGDLNGAVAACDEQRGSLANVLKGAIQRFKGVENDASLNQDQKLSDVQRVIDENMNLETPLLERNLVI